MTAENDKKKSTILWAIVAVIAVVPIVALFHYIGKPASGFPAALSVLMLAIAVKVRWELSRRPWFWITIAALAIVHAPLVWFNPWSTRWVPSFIVTPFCIVDGLAILGIITFVEKLNSQVPTSESINSANVHKRA